MNQPNASTTVFVITVYFDGFSDKTPSVNGTRLIPATTAAEAVTMAKRHVEIISNIGFAVSRIVVTQETHELDPERGLTVSTIFLWDSTLSKVTKEG